MTLVAAGRLEALRDEAESENGVGETIASRLKRGDAIEGFGHVVYRGVDPRAKILMELLEEAVPNAVELAMAMALLETPPPSARRMMPKKQCHNAAY